MPNSKQPHGLQPTRLFCPWDFLGKDTAVGCHFLLQGIFPTQGSNLGLLHCRQILYRLSYKGNVKIAYLVHKIHLHYTSQYLVFTWNILYKSVYASLTAKTKSRIARQMPWHKKYPLQLKAKQKRLLSKGNWRFFSPNNSVTLLLSQIV